LFTGVDVGWCTTGVNKPRCYTEASHFCTISCLLRYIREDSNLEPRD
jgi:hypothetical protein